MVECLLAKEKIAGSNPVTRFEGASNQHSVKPMFFVYVLQSLKTGRLYIGQTNNLAARIWRHNNGKSLATKAWRPYWLLSYEVFQLRGAAMKRERYLKSLKSPIAVLRALSLTR